MSYQPSDDSHADMTWNDPWGFHHSSWHKTSNTFRSHSRLAALATARQYHTSTLQLTAVIYQKTFGLTASFSLHKNWASTTMFSCHTSIFQSMDHFKCRQKASRSQAKSSRKVHVYATVSFSLPSGKSNMSSTPFPGSHPKHTHLAWKCPFASDSLIPLMTN